MYIMCMLEVVLSVCGAGVYVWVEFGLSVGCVRKHVDISELFG